MNEETPYRDQTETVWNGEEHLREMGGWLHANNVLFYFALSPFFDKSSENQAIFLQYTNTEQQDDFLGTRQKFEATLKKRAGLSYVVAHDPLQPPKVLDAPDGSKHGADVWVIKKQYRSVPNDESQIRVLAYYYVTNRSIYEAPTIAKLLENRMLNVTDVIGKVFSEVAQYSLYSVSHGHTYTKPEQASLTQKEAAAAQQSKESTPMLGLEGPGAEKVDNGGDEDEEGSQTLLRALQLTMKYGKEYSNEMPLIGEPGNFRFAKKADVASKASTVGQVASSQVLMRKAGSQTPSRATSVTAGAK